MRRYRIRKTSVDYNQLFMVSNTDDNDDDKPAYVFYYKGDNLGAKLILIDSTGRVLLNARQISQFHLTFDIYSVDETDHQQLVGVVRRRGAPWRHRFTVQSSYGPYELKSTGKLFSHQYQMIQGQRSVARVKQADGEDASELASVEIEEEVDSSADPFILTLVMVRSS